MTKGVGKRELREGERGGENERERKEGDAKREEWRQRGRRTER